jgi:hypothetical protein
MHGLIVAQASSYDAARCGLLLLLEDMQLRDAGPLRTGACTPLATAPLMLSNSR